MKKNQIVQELIKYFAQLKTILTFYLLTVAFKLINIFILILTNESYIANEIKATFKCCRQYIDPS